jgi:hypothetical protein
MTTAVVMKQIQPKSEWVMQWAGSYKSKVSGWLIERSVGGGWNVYNNQGGLVDSRPTLKAAQGIYSNYRQGKQQYACNQCLGDVYEYPDLVEDAAYLRCQKCKDEDGC